jgi:hypothetical protein
MNPSDLQNWHTVICSFATIKERLGAIKIPDYDPSRLSEYRNAAFAVFFRLPTPNVFCSFDAIKNTYALLKDNNSILEACEHYLNGKFDLISDMGVNGFYSDLSRPDQRRFQQYVINVNLFVYTDIECLNKIKAVIGNLNS